MLTKNKLFVSVILLIGIILFANIISEKFFARLDFTEDQRYSLSDATLNILDELTEPVTVTAYFSEDLPPDIAKTKQDFRDLLIEYANRSDDMVVYEFINPNESQETEANAQQNGIRPVMINVRERDQVKQQRAYLGAVIQLGEMKETIPFIQPGAAMEYELSSTIKKIAVTDKPSIALLQGHGEPSLGALQQLSTLLTVTHNLTPVEFTDTSGIPLDYSTAMIIAPSDSLGERDINYLNEFLERGGRLLLALNRVDGNFQTGQGEEISTGLEDWLMNLGIEMGKNFIVDANCSSVMVRQQQGMFTFNTPVSFPYLPIISNFADHPAVTGLESVMMPFVSSIDYSNVDTSKIKVTPLAFTSEKSGIENLPLFFDVGKDWKSSDFPESSLPIAVALDGELSNGVQSKMIIFSDGDFAVNGEGDQAQQLQPDNVNLMVNSIDWLADDTGLNSLRTKGVTARPLSAQLEDGTKTVIKYLNFLIPILIIIIYGIIRFQMRRKFRNKLSSISYE